MNKQPWHWRDSIPGIWALAMIACILAGLALRDNADDSNEQPQEPSVSRTHGTGEPAP